MIQTSFISQGWECPKCKRVYSPTTSMCSYCPQYGQGSSTTTSITGGTTSITYSHAFTPNLNDTSGVCTICGKQSWEHPIAYTTNNK